MFDSHKKKLRIAVLPDFPIIDNREGSGYVYRPCDFRPETVGRCPVSGKIELYARLKDKAGDILSGCGDWFTVERKNGEFVAFMGD